MEQTHSASYPVAPENWRRGFWSLIVTQFQGAFSDNALQKLVTVLALSMGLSQELRDKMVPAVGAIFALPFILFSMSCGFFAGRFGQLPLTVRINGLDVSILVA